MEEYGFIVEGAEVWLDPYDEIAVGLYRNGEFMTEYCFYYSLYNLRSFDDLEFYLNSGNCVIGYLNVGSYSFTSKKKEIKFVRKRGR